MILQIKGDGSYLGLVDTGTYKGFVGSDWAKNPKLLEPHFIEQMNNYVGLFWDTNLESNWVIEIRTAVDNESGYREVTGSIKVSGGSLMVLEYNSLSAMAQFEDQTIEKQTKDNVITLEDGNYQVRVIQKFDPQIHFPDGISTDFVIEIDKSDVMLPPWQKVPWSKL